MRPLLTQRNSSAAALAARTRSPRREQIAAQVPAVRDRLDIVAMILNEGPEGLPRGLVALPANKKE